MVKARRSKRHVVVDGRDHLYGRLASNVAKELLRGKRVSVVRCEKIVQTGAKVRLRAKFQYWLKKRHLTNPKRGPFHNRSPSKIFERSVRGMLPSSVRGKACLRRLNAVEGVPPAYQKVKRFVCPTAMRAVRLAPTREYTKLGDLAELVGWKYASVVEDLEAKRAEKDKAYWEAKTQRQAWMQQAIKAVDGKK
eukprot:NODE_1805_length_733_cov_86.698020_g1755_i0.p2 GENE.NODE_1805_length_733_cov_86.698020_g1755_i0~~NODE_1805_length_733_cov_86.698020_g1755_i0.p2  ORF type:complete len:193 (-),score=44.09 NODE_1805_length_733_cov_86.698020_g1755_i0:87-665(-)